MADKGQKKSSGAQKQAQPKLLDSYFSNHSKVAKSTLNQFLSRPIANLFTCSVIGIALVLPSLLALLLTNLQTAQVTLDDNAQITLFLSKELSETEASQFAQDLEKRASIDKSIFISSTNALAELSANFDIDSALSHLDNNPLPHSVVITPAKSLQAIDQLERLKEQLLSLENVDRTLLDALWVQRLSSITSFLESAIWIIAIMLAFAVLLIVGNTIRLAIENRREEIIVLKLVGGTTPFVCRPFLYAGTLFGLGGSILAIILVQVTIMILSAPVETLAESYQSNFSLSGLNFESTLFLLVAGMSLGWFGSWLAVHKHIEDIEPT